MSYKLSPIAETWTFTLLINRLDPIQSTGEFCLRYFQENNGSIFVVINLTYNIFPARLGFGFIDNIIFSPQMNKQRNAQNKQTHPTNKNSNTTVN